ncbi:Actin-like protein arp8 [Elasticomyces elasticus]|nr:Actin-like protein arp8 [Elasticomyces elasticus]
MAASEHDQPKELLYRDDQILTFRLQAEENRNRMTKAARDRDRALAHGQNGLPYTEPDADVDDDMAMEDGAISEAYGSKTIVVHPGSQNLRLGLATDALPKTVPMVIARRAQESEAEADGGEPRPKRMKLDDGSQPTEPEKWFGEEFAAEYNTMAAEFRTYRRNNKRKVLPNSRELVVNWNTRTPPETIYEHNDPLRIDWTELPPDPSDAPDFFTGHAALRIPEQSTPRYRLYWPLQHGWLNEKDYSNKNLLYRDFFTIIEEAIKTQLGLRRKKDWAQYSCVFIIPDLYEKVLVSAVLQEMLRDFGFQRVCFIQESLAASFGAGYSISCIVDVGAQKTSICCVEEGMCVDQSRINLKYGGADVTETFIKMMLFDHLKYSDINLKRRHDWLLAEELKQKFCVMDDTNTSVMLFEFHLRAHGQNTRKYQWKAYDEPMLAPLGFFRPTIFDHSRKMLGRRSLIDGSKDLYDGTPNDPMTNSQFAILQSAAQNLPGAMVAKPSGPEAPGSILPVSTPSRQQTVSAINRLHDLEGTPRSSIAGSPPPEESETPQPAAGDATPAVTDNSVQGPQPDTEVQDRTVPIMPIDQAILASIGAGAGNDDRRMRDFLGGIMVIGGGAKFPGFTTYLEQRLRVLMPNYGKEILIGPPPRELDPQVLVWKGGSVFAKLGRTNDSWIGQMEYDRLGARVLNYKCMWAW